MSFIPQIRSLGSRNFWRANRADNYAGRSEASVGLGSAHRAQTKEKSEAVHRCQRRSVFGVQKRWSVPCASAWIVRMARGVGRHLRSFGSANQAGEDGRTMKLADHFARWFHILRHPGHVGRDYAIRLRRGKTELVGFSCSCGKSIGDVMWSRLVR